MANYTRTSGANARAQSWGDFEEQPGTGGRCSCLPLDILDEHPYGASPQLRAMPGAPAAPRRSIFGPRQPQQAPAQPTRTYPTRKQASEREKKPRRTGAQIGVGTRAVAVVLGGVFGLLAAYAVVSMVVDWTQTKLNDLQYGRRRP